MVTTASSSLAPGADEMRGVLPEPSRAWHLEQLQHAVVFRQRLLRHQPSLASVSQGLFRLSINAAFSGQGIDPEKVFLLEGRPQGASPRSMMQVMQEALVSGRVPQAAEIVGFCAVEDGDGRRTTLTGIDSTVFADVAAEHLRGLFEHYTLKLRHFWCSPVRQAGDIAMRDALLRYWRSELEAEAALRRADNLADPTQGISVEGLSLMQGLARHEVHAARRVEVVTYSVAIRGAAHDIDLGASMVLAPPGGLFRSKPVLLSTPQRGLEAFASGAALLNELNLRQVTPDARDELLLNVCVCDRARALDVLVSGRGSWAIVERSSDREGSLLGPFLDAQLAQQQANLRAAFVPPRPGLQARVAAALALTGGMPGDLARRPLRPDTLPVVPSADLAVGDQQHNLMRQLDALNALTGRVLEGSPGFDRFFQAQLSAMFPAMGEPISPLQIYLSRYRLDEQGQKHLLSCQTLKSALARSLATTGVEGPGADGQAQAFYTEPDTLDDAYRLQPVGTLSSLAAALKTAYPTLLREFWHSFQGGRGSRQDLLVSLRKQLLATEAALRTVDGTLTVVSRALIDDVLKYPAHSARMLAFPQAPRPQVFAVCLADGSRFAGVFALSADSAEPAGGALVFWSPGEGFEAFSDLAALREALCRRLNEGGDAGVLLASSLPLAMREQKTGSWDDPLAFTLAAVTDDCVADAVGALISRQQQDLASVLRSDTALEIGRVGLIVDLVPQLDVATLFVARNRYLEEALVPAWQKALGAQDRQHLLNLETVARESNRALATLLQAIPSLSGYAKEKLRLKLQAFLETHGLPGTAAGLIDPDSVMVVRSESVRVNYVPGPGITRPIERVSVERMSLTDLALKNLNPWEKSLSWSSSESMGAVLTYADGATVFNRAGEALSLTKEVLEDWVKGINVGHHYREDILKQAFAPPTASEQARSMAQAWMAAQASTLAYEAALASLSQIAYSTALSEDPGKKRGAQWVAAVLASEVPHTRPKVDGRSVVANFLTVGTPNLDAENGGSQLVHGVIIFTTASDPEWVLYAPDAPDGRELREVSGALALRDLLEQPQWQRYWVARLLVRGPYAIERPLSLWPTLARIAGFLTRKLTDPPLRQHLLPLALNLVPCEAPLLQGLYVLQVVRLMEVAGRGAVSNAQVSRQSAFNKVMFGIEVAGQLLDMFPWVTHWVSSTARVWGRLARTAVQTFRARGQNVPGLILRLGPGGRWLPTMEAAAERAVSIGVKPLQVYVPRFQAPATTRLPLLQVPETAPSVSFIPKGWHTSALPQKQAETLLSGLEPNSRGIYRTAAGEYLIRPIDANGQAAVYRIKADFKLYSGADLTVQVIDASSRIEVGLLHAGARGQWQSVAVKGAGAGVFSKPVRDLPEAEYLLTDGYAENKHGILSLSQELIAFYDDWFKRDWQRFFKENIPPARPATPMLAPTATVIDLIKSIFDNGYGLVLGERHSEMACVTFLQDNMQTLYGNGVRTLFIEGSHATEDATLWVRPGSGNEARRRVASKASACGMAVRGLDDDYLTLHRNRDTDVPHINIQTRLQEMNYFAVRQIETYHPPGSDDGKWVAWVGANHMNTAEGVPGLAELTGTLGLLVRDAKPLQRMAIKIPGERLYTPGGAVGDVQLELDVSLSGARAPSGAVNFQE